MIKLHPTFICRLPEIRHGLIGALWFSLIVLSSQASAHPVLVAKPTQTLADRILQSDTLVLAREDPQRPFHYAAVKTIRGEPGTTSIDLFMPTHVGRRLNSNPELTVLVGSRAKKDKWYGMGVTSDDYLQMVDLVLSRADVWTPGEANNIARLHDFAGLLGNEDVRLHELAYLEIGRATYASIRDVGADVPLQQVRSMLDNPTYFDWRGLDIMLLGLYGTEQDHARILNEMYDRQRLSSDKNLAAWATAYLEIRGTDGLDQLVEWYFVNPERSREELRSIARAMAGHANEAEELREPVVAAYSTLLETHPGAAPDIAHDLIAWKQWGLAPQLQKLQPELARRNPLGVYKVNLYLQRARAFQGKPKD